MHDNIPIATNFGRKFSDRIGCTLISNMLNIGQDRIRGGAAMEDGDFGSGDLQLPD